MSNKMENNKRYTVYMHTSPSEKRYIGITSRKPEKRWSKGNGYKQNSYFWNAICKYGWNNIKHEILYTGLTKEEAEEKEIELIAFYKSDIREFGYNIDHGGKCVGTMSQETKDKLSKIRKGMTGEKSGFYGRKHTEESKLKMSMVHKGVKLSEEQKQKISEAGKIPVLQYTKSLEFIQRWDSIMEAAKAVGISTSIISSCCRNNIGSAGGFVWRYEFPELVGNPKGHTNPDTYKSVDQYSLDGKFIATYIHIKEASEKTGIDSSTISKCCQDKQRKTGGFIWRYNGEELTEKYIEWCNGTGREEARTPIIQYSLNGELLKVWESINAVQKELGYNASAIIRVCKGDQKTSYDFIWRYADDKELTNEDIEQCQSINKKKMVAQYSLGGEFIRMYDSISVASKITGIDASNIAKCCKGKVNRTKGFIWRYASEIQDPYAPLFPTASTLQEAI